MNLVTESAGILNFKRMQYWIIYKPGVGGDGFANLLEHCDNVLPADGVLEWRVHYRIQEHIKFYSCAWAQEPKPFRRLGIRNSVLNPHYVDCIQNEHNTVIPAHYFYWDDYPQSEHKQLVTTDQFIIHLYSSNPDRAFRDAFVKNRREPKPELYQDYCSDIKKELERSQYQCHIDIEQVWRSWSYLEEQLNKIGIKLNQEVYDQYMELINA